MENRHGLVVRRERTTNGGDEGYETRDFVKTFRT
jgi:hypothetical protein